MATLNSPISTRDPRAARGGGGIDPPIREGGGGGRGGDPTPDPGERLRRARLGLAVASISITMLFVGFASAYIFREGQEANHFYLIRHGRVAIEIDDETLRALRISGTFYAYDTDSFAAYLGTLNGVVVQTTPTRIRVRGLASASGKLPSVAR